MRVGVYPGSFNPPTVAHLAISEAARDQHQLDQVVWSLSTTTLAKEHVDRPLFGHRLEVLEATAAGTSWLEVQVTQAQLLAEIAVGFDVLIMGADKWAQIQEPRWYDSEADRLQALTGLPVLAVAPRPPVAVPDEFLLALHADHAVVSSSAARAGYLDLMLPHARVFAERSGAWVDAARYEQHLLDN